MSKARRVGSRQWRILGVLSIVDPLPITAGRALDQAGLLGLRGSAWDGVRGMVNAGLVRHVCSARLPCMRPGGVVGRHCFLSITDAGLAARLSRTGWPAAGR